MYNSSAQSNLTFIYASGFVREWNQLRLNDEDLRALEQLIAKSPSTAPVIRATGGLRKIRFAPPSAHRGKSGAMRVGFAYFQRQSTVIVVSVYAKNEAANLTAAQCAEIEKWLKRIERTLQ